MRHPSVSGLALALGAVLALSACSDGPRRYANGPVTPDPGTDPTAKHTRYAFANRCVVLKSADNGKYVAAADEGFAATADLVAGAEPFFLKPAALGDYLLYTRAGTLVNGAAPVDTVALASASDDAVFRLLADGDNTSYPTPLQYDVAPTPEQIASYRNFVDPNLQATQFTLAAADGMRLTASGTEALTLAAAGTGKNQRFRLEPVTGCLAFPEASDNTVGETFKGRTADGRVLGMADVHVHASSSTFLGGAMHGRVFHKFGVTHALEDCDTTHGPMGIKDVLSAAYEGDTDGHANDGWPTFSEWPSRDSLTHRAIYWKWIERAWKSGLRIMVNDVVENGTLCELQRNASLDPAADCNEMNSARRQIGTLYALQDYIDGQYGGRGKGFFQIVLDPAEARRKIADGKLAVVIGIEVSNLFDCQITYSPLRTEEPFEETGSGLPENRYGCAMTETGASNEIKTQLTQMKDLGMRQIITIHEFDNAFGGNGIFDGMILNLGNRENSGGIPFGSPSGPFLPTGETPTGEFWTTYNCPEENVTPGFSGYFWGSAGGATMQNFGPPEELCPFLGQGGRPGGTTACYPAQRQCNARLLTPIGLYTYALLMKNGIIFDIDHLTIEMKSQALELAEAQTPAYPFVSTHGTFGGTSVDQARRILKNGGFLYPSLGSVRGFRQDLDETRTESGEASNPHLFGFGFGTDTDGLSGQEGPRGEIDAGKELKYPYTLFAGEPFATIPDFAGMQGVVFRQPEERDAAGEGRTWSMDLDGSAHYGMMSDFVQEMRLEGTRQDMIDLFNAAEVYLQTWERTLAAQAAINQKGIVIPEGVLRAAPGPGETMGQ